ncbi:hypothetical protein TRFO_29098 [Tritrichomonas foetus]|uniref:Uncharacterized protein n=1 Tax=Tritrichomonas foetus TaxID=1144522 RepID=A0A1J4K180_9EUKA|nr:hypothetical protein TRFO_29098 [Tritrichomonas foetus]|eukprot:OHT03500.1 hypothetical protein TRFO_29098 [Tritrichomonas foetus]
MNESETEEDPFLAVSDDSENEKAIQEIDAFLNAPSAFVVQGLDPNNPNVIAKSQGLTSPRNSKENNTKGENNENIFSKDNLSSAKISSSNIFELTDSAENTELSTKNSQLPASSIPSQNMDKTPLNNNSNANDSNKLQKINNKNKKNLGNEMHSSPEKGKRRPPIQNHGLLTNMDLTNALMLSDDNNNNENKATNKTINHVVIQEPNNNSKTSKNKNKKKNSSLTKKNHLKDLSPDDILARLAADEDDSFNSDDESAPSPLNSPPESISHNNVLNAPDNHDLSNSNSEINQSETIPSNTDKKDENNKQNVTNQKQTNLSSQNQNISNQNESAINRNPQSNQNRQYFQQSTSQFYDSPKSVTEIFEYSFYSYLRMVTEDLKLTFTEEMRSLMAFYFDFDRYIIDFMTDLEHELDDILQEGLSNLNLSETKYDTSFINDFFDQISSMIPKKDKKENDLISMPSYELVQSAHTSFVSNCSPLLSILTEDFDVSQFDENRFKESRLFFTNEQNNEKILDLEAREYEIELEKQYIDQRVNLLTRSIANFRENSISLFSQDADSSYDLDFSDSIREIIDQLNHYDVKNITLPFSSFANKNKSVADEVSVTNFQLFSKIDRFSRSLNLIKSHNLTEAQAQAQSQQQAQIQKQIQRRTGRHSPTSSHLSLPIGSPISLQNAFLDFEPNYHSPPSRCNFVNSVKERLTQIKQKRQNQIADINNYPPGYQ